MTGLSSSVFVPLALGFFGLGVGYFVWGGQLLFNYPPSAGTAGGRNLSRGPDTPNPDIPAAEGVGPRGAIPSATDRAMGLWGIWMPGFMQFLAGIIIWIGITWFHVFDPGKTNTPLYMAALAFTAFGVHWFVLGYRRYIQANVLPDAWMAVAFLLLSILGIIVFAAAKDMGVTILFIGLALIYLTEAVVRFGVNGIPLGDRLVGVWQVLTGILLMYLTYAVVLNNTTTIHWPA